MRTVLRLLPWMGVLLLPACRQTLRHGPPQVEFGRTECSRCGMIVNEERFAAGYINEENQDVVFDDLGEFFQDIRHRQLKFYVRDVEGGGWLPAAEAFYVRVPGLATPMGSGIIAFKRQEQASGFALDKKTGKVFDFESAVKNLGTL